MHTGQGLEKASFCSLPDRAQPGWPRSTPFMLGTGLLAVVLSCPCSVCLHSLGTSHQAGEDGSSGEHTYLPELPIVDQLRPVSVDQGTETKAILPTVQRERER